MIVDGLDMVGLGLCIDDLSVGNLDDRADTDLITAIREVELGLGG